MDTIFDKRHFNISLECLNPLIPTKVPSCWLNHWGLLWYTGFVFTKLLYQCLTPTFLGESHNSYFQHCQKEETYPYKDFNWPKPISTAWYCSWINLHCTVGTWLNGGLQEKLLWRLKVYSNSMSQIWKEEKRMHHSEIAQSSKHADTYTDGTI